MGKHAGSIKSSMENITGKYGEISKKNKAIKKRLASMIRAHDNHIVKRNRNAIDSNNSGALVQSAWIVYKWYRVSISGIGRV